MIFCSLSGTHPANGILNDNARGKTIVGNVYERQQNENSHKVRTIIINGPRIFFVVAAVIGSLTATAAVASDTHVYRVELDSELRRLDVSATFGTPVSDISARSRSAAQFLEDARRCDDGAPIRIRGRRLITPPGGITCLEYSVDLQGAARAEQRNHGLHASNAIVSPTVWMWRPRLGGYDEIHVRFDVPQGMRVSVPWEPMSSDDNSYRLRASPQSGSAVAIFGHFESSVVPVAGAELRVDLPRTREDVALAPTVEWVREAARNVTLAYGRFPNPTARVIVFPMAASPWTSNSPVYFGRVVRDGGETVELLIDPRKPQEAFYADWTATHELSHMMLPYVRRQQRWLSEGFAQYYQNVLLARAGRYSQRDAWQKLYDGFERGRASAPTLSPNQATGGGERNTRMKIYWSGAALALMADVELRRRSQGAESLDDVLSRFQNCCLPSQRAWSGKELVAAFDALLDEPVFAGLYRQYADTAGFPDVRPLLLRLGVSVVNGEVHLENDAELAEIRATLTAQRYTDRPGK